VYIGVCEIYRLNGLEGNGWKEKTEVDWIVCACVRACVSVLAREREREREGEI